MRALSIRQPWAWLVLHAGKDVENRTCSTCYRGRILVHAGLQLNRDAYAWVAEHFPHLQLPAPRELQLGGYLGESGLVLRSAKPGTFVASTGKLSLYAVDDALLQLVHPDEAAT